MYKMRLREPIDEAKLRMGYVETDPSGRYGRFKEVLGKGAMKTVYKAFDEELGMEVAWNQVQVKDVFQSPKELQRLYSEVHLLRNLNHESIIKLCANWIDVYSRTFNFITEMLTSGTLREYRKKYKRVNIQAIKNWARQILHGLAYLHGLDPPVIHRDLKCDNIFVNGHLGQVKIGDLGFAAILSRTHHAHSVIGTPEFMAPELYEEEYDELVDVYSFGMCMLEMLTSEYPYSECSNPAQIYKKVISGKLPAAIQRIEDVKAKNFVKKCLQNVAKRPSAQELLADPFLDADTEVTLPVLSIKSRPMSTGELTDLMLMEPKSRKTNMTITGTMDPTNDIIFLKVKITDEDGEARNVYFPFDTLSDTAVDVANEMVKELEITDWEPLQIAEMINEAISAIVPLWSRGKLIENQYSFDYNDGNDDDDDDRIHHPFYSHSTHSSSQGFLPSPELHILLNRMGSSGLLPENFLFNNDDTSSHGSTSSHNYSNLHFYSGIGNELELSPPTGNHSNFIANNQTPMRFHPEQRKGETCQNRTDPLLCANRRSYGSSGHGKISRVKSLLDIRSQLLHRSLVEEVSRRRLFKTIGAIENIGFKEF